MSLALFGLLLLVSVIVLAWKKARAAFAALLGILLGVVIAGSHGGLADLSHHMVDSIRSTIDAAGNSIFP